MAKMTRAEVEAYLAAPGRLVRIGSVHPDGSPLVVPAWFIVEDGVFYVTPRDRSAWLANVRHEPRVCFTVDGDGHQVVIRGTARIVHDVGADDEWRDRYRRITMRYVPEEWGDAYLRDTWDEPRALLALHLADARITTWRFPLREGEDWLDVWAPRYYHDGHPRARQG